MGSISILERMINRYETNWMANKLESIYIINRDDIRQSECYERIDVYLNNINENLYNCYKKMREVAYGND